MLNTRLRIDEHNQLGLHDQLISATLEKFKDLLTSGPFTYTSNESSNYWVAKLVYQQYSVYKINVNKNVIARLNVHVIYLKGRVLEFTCQLLYVAWKIFQSTSTSIYHTMIRIRRQSGLLGTQYLSYHGTIGFGKCNCSNRYHSLYLSKLPLPYLMLLRFYWYSHCINTQCNYAWFIHFAQNKIEPKVTYRVLPASGIVSLFFFILCPPSLS